MLMLMRAQLYLMHVYTRPSIVDSTRLLIDGEGLLTHLQQNTDDILTMLIVFCLFGV